MIREITFEEIKPMWELLWPGRDDIKPMSSMSNHDPNAIDMTIYDKYEPTFFGIFTDDTNELVAVNSCHPTTDKRMRSRGLFVKVGYGGKGLGQFILQCTINYAKDKGFAVIWSIPRKTAIKTYTAVGFVEQGEPIYCDSYPTSGVMQQELNYYVEKKL